MTSPVDPGFLELPFSDLQPESQSSSYLLCHTLRTVAPASRAVVGGRGRKGTVCLAISGPRLPNQRERLPSFQVFVQQAPTAATVAAALLLLAERKDRSVSPPSEHWEPTFVLLEPELEGFSPNSVCAQPPLLCIGSPQVQAEGYWRVERKKQEMQ